MKYWPWSLLLAAMALQGAKTPVTFLIWGAIALSLCVYILLKRSSSIQISPATYLFVCLFLAAQIFSLDATASLFQTTQGLLFVLLWICLHADLEAWGSE